MRKQRTPPLLGTLARHLAGMSWMHPVILGRRHEERRWIIGIRIEVLIGRDRLQEGALVGLDRLAVELGGMDESSEGAAVTHHENAYWMCAAGTDASCKCTCYRCTGLRTGL